MADIAQTSYEPQDLFTLGGEEVRKQNRELTVARRDFSERVETAIAEKDYSVMQKDKDGNVIVPPRVRTKREKLKALNKILQDPEAWKHDPTMCMQVFSACRELGQSASMIQAYESAENDSFKNASMVREQLAGAYAKEGDKAKAAEISQELIDSKQASSISYTVLGKCQSPEEAKKTFEKGFKETLDPFVGLQAVQANIRAGGEDDKKHAQELAKVVYLSALRDGAEESTDFYTLSAALQTAIIAGEKSDKIDHFVSRIAKSVEHPWELEELKRNMQALEKAGINPEMTQGIQGQLQNMENTSVAEVKTSGKKQKSGVVAIEATDDRTFGDDEKLTALRKHSYNYRGCGSDFRGVSRVGGNMEFGGQLPSHTVSKKDLELFTGLVNASPEALGMTAEDLKGIKGANLEQPLSEIKDPELFMQIADKFIRKTFMTENYTGSGLHLEDNALAKEADGKSIYDRTVVGELETCGKNSNIRGMEKAEQAKEKAFVDTRTNIAAIFALGMGDCRHHAQVKQIMFDMYQRQQMNASLQEMLGEIDQGKTVDIQNGQAAQDFYEVLDTELRTSDVKIMLPVIMKQEEWEGKMYDMMYQPDLTDDGKFAIDHEFDQKSYQASARDGKTQDHLHCLEEHTFCWLTKKDRQGKLESFGLRDAFYQTEGKMYQWGHRDIPLEAIHTDSGKLEIDAGAVAGEKSADGEDFPIYLRPTNYNSGKRDQKVMSSTGRDICMVGIEVSGFDTTESFIGLINAGEKKIDALRVMQADGKAIVAEQAAQAAKGKVAEATSEEEAKKLQEAAQKKESYAQTQGKIAEIKRSLAEDRRRSPKDNEPVNVATPSKTPIQKDLMKVDRDLKNKRAIAAHSSNKLRGGM